MRSRSSPASASPCSHLVGPSAAVRHSGASGWRRELKVGSPPTVSVSPASASVASARSAAASSACQVSSGYGVVGRASWPSRPTRSSKEKESAPTSEVPLMGAASAGRATQASGMCPSPQKRPLVASSPIQPAPGR